MHLRNLNLGKALPEAVSEIHRVLKPSGTFFAATNGVAHLRELWTLVDPFIPGAFERVARVAGGFTLQNGAASLIPSFARVTRHDYPDAPEVTDADAIVVYLASSNTLAAMNFTTEIASVLRAQVTAHIEAQGAYHIGKASGLFAAHP